MISCAQILFIPERESPSHIWSMMSLASRLQDGGHNITFLDFNGKPVPSVKFPKGIGVIHLNYTDSDPIKTSTLDLMWTNRWRGKTLWKSYLQGEKYLQLSYKQFKHKYSELLSKRWDLIILDVMDNNHGYVISKIMHDLNVPYIIFHTSIMFHSLSTAAGLNHNPISRMSMFASHPPHNYQSYDPTNFNERFDQIMDSSSETYNMLKRVPSFMKTFTKIIGEEFSWENLYKEASYAFSEGIDEFGFPSPVSTSFISTGSYCLERDEASLEKPILDFVNKQSSGTIYIAFGSIVKWESAPKHIKSIFFEALDDLTEFQIVFVYPPNDYTFKSHVKTVSWINQAALLKQNKTKVFLSHGGLKSFRESLCAQVPMVILPLFAEQAYNCRVGVERGFAAHLNKLELSKEKIVSRIRQVALQDTFKEKLKKNLAIYSDQPMGELDRAMFYVERAIRLTSRRKPQFKIRYAFSSWLTYNYYELHAVLLLLIIIIS